MADPNATTRAQRLAQLLLAQLEIYRNVLELSRRQEQLVNENDKDGLMRLLSQKQGMIARIEPLARDVAPLQVAWEVERESLSDPTRQTVEQAVNKLREVLGEIVEIENRVRSSIEGDQQETNDKIVKVQKGRALNKAYGTTSKMPPQARYKDKQG